ncbi:MAG: hypothetical protein KME64_07445 [Scytonematopsis contorta HA4267-MV1]|nr:hypothetical protein [Scytonematopsis contorta HA4267-MV1]
MDCLYHSPFPTPHSQLPTPDSPLFFTLTIDVLTVNINTNRGRLKLLFLVRPFIIL